MLTNRADLAKVLEVHDRCRDFAVQLEKEGIEQGYILDAFMAVGINISAMIAGPRATAACLMEWVEKLHHRADHPGAPPGTTH